MQGANRLLNFSEEMLPFYGHTQRWDWEYQDPEVSIIISSIFSVFSQELSIALFQLKLWIVKKNEF